MTTIMNYKSNITHISGYRWESCFKNILWILSACHILWSTCKHISNRVTVYSLYCHKHLSSKRQNEININCTTAHVKSTVEGSVIFLITLLISAITLQLHQRMWWQSTNITDGWTEGWTDDIHTYIHTYIRTKGPLWPLTMLCELKVIWIKLYKTVLIACDSVNF